MSMIPNIQKHIQKGKYRPNPNIQKYIYTQS